MTLEYQGKGFLKLRSKWRITFLEMVRYIYKHSKLKHLYCIDLQCIAVIICISNSMWVSDGVFS